MPRLMMLVMTIMYIKVINWGMSLDDLSTQIISVPILDKLDNETLNLLNPNSEIFTIELGRSVGWDSHIKNIKKSFSINSFGKSAPIEDLINEFDFSAEKIANEIKNLIN